MVKFFRIGRTVDETGKRENGSGNSMLLYNRRLAQLKRHYCNLSV